MPRRNQQQQTRIVSIKRRVQAPFKRLNAMRSKRRGGIIPPPRTGQTDDNFLDTAVDVSNGDLSIGLGGGLGVDTGNGNLTIQDGPIAIDAGDAARTAGEILGAMGDGLGDFLSGAGDLIGDGANAAGDLIGAIFDALGSMDIDL